MLYLFIRKIELPHYYASLKLQYKVVNKSSLIHPSLIQIYAFFCLNLEQAINRSNFFRNSSFSEGKIDPAKRPETASCAFLVFKFSGGGPLNPLSEVGCTFTVQHKTSWKSEESTQGVKTHTHLSGVYFLNL